MEPTEGRVERSWLDRLLRRRVVRYPDGRVDLESFGFRAALRWYRKQDYWRNR